MLQMMELREYVRANDQRHLSLSKFNKGDERDVFKMEISLSDLVLNRHDSLDRNS